MYTNVATINILLSDINVSTRNSEATRYLISMHLKYRWIFIWKQIFSSFQYFGNMYIRPFVIQLVCYKTNKISATNGSELTERV